jgi:hypothetical protein
MLRPSELRSGNYLKGEELSIPRLQMHSNGIVQISPYGIHMIEQLQVEGKDLGYLPINLNHFWFKEFQFTRTHKEVTNGGLEYLYSKSFKHNGRSLKFEVYSDDNGTFFSMYQQPKHDLEKKRYVHQLQNMYFLFTDQELVREF